MGTEWRAEKWAIILEFRMQIALDEKLAKPSIEITMQSNFRRFELRTQTLETE